MAREYLYHTNKPKVKMEVGHSVEPDPDAGTSDSELKSDNDDEKEGEPCFSLSIRTNDVLIHRRCRLAPLA